MMINGPKILAINYTLGVTNLISICKQPIRIIIKEKKVVLVYSYLIGERSGCIPVNQSNMPFGQGSAPANYKTLYREHYVPMSLRKCPARVVLEEICDHATDLDPTLPAVSQLYQK